MVPKIGIFCVALLLAETEPEMTVVVERYLGIVVSMIVDESETVYDPIAR